MLKKKALRKIFITTLTAFVLLVVYLIPSTKTEEKTLKTNLEVEYITSLGTNNIYLLDKDNLLVKTKILLDSNNKKEQVREIIDNLKDKDNELLPSGLKGLIPEKTKLKYLKYENNVIVINFSNDFLKVDEKKSIKMIEAIVFSIMDLDSVDGIQILVDGNLLTTYPKTEEKLPELLTKNIGINKKSEITSRNNIQKIVIYYVEDISKNRYYVPVTKYINDTKEKVKIIVDELSSSYIYEPNLMSFLSDNVVLENYEEKENAMLLDFSNAFFDSNGKVVEEVLYTMAYSIFDNYDVDMVIFQVNSKTVKELTVKDLP